jgi:hypothetical protein
MVKKHYIIASIYIGATSFAFYYFLRNVANWDTSRIINAFIMGAAFVAIAVLLMYYSSKSDE